ncbi:unnamed protein product [Sympodiomycopsis kandeliae]
MLLRRSFRTMTTRAIHPKPDINGGITYWQGVPATVDGVLGGYGLGTLPRVDALGSRTFLLGVLPRLSSIAPVTDDAVEWKKTKLQERGGKGKSVTRALDCGAGVGRVTRDVLSKIVDQVHLAEPVRKFLLEASRESSTWPSLTLPPSRSPLNARKSAHFHVTTLQALDPAHPYTTSDGGVYTAPNGEQKLLSKKSKLDDQEQIPPTISPADPDSPEDLPSTSASAEPLSYDVIWCQWMLQHLSDPDLRSFLNRSKKALVSDGIIVVKENVCSEQDDGSENVWWDEEDKSITRSTLAYERVFQEAGLNVVRCQVQEGLPDELFVVKMWALR